MGSTSVEFFDTQFRRQLQQGGSELNPFELAALPYLQGRVLDFGCGLGNLAVAAARLGCLVVALDASHAAIEHLRTLAAAGQLPIEAIETDLRNYALAEEFDTVVSIGLLMFFDCPTALRQLASLKAHVRPGGVAVVNVLVEGTTYLDMFDAGGHCLLARDELRRRFQGWDLLHCEQQDFEAPDQRIKSFVTLIARRPAA